MLDPSFCQIPLAHRGLHDAARARRENSLSAMQAAVDAGYGIELDLQISADGQAMVFHDETLDRMTVRAGWVASTSAAALAATPLLDGGGDTIPTLEQVLECVAGKVPLLIELKDQTLHPGGTLGPLELATAEALRGYDGPVAVMSFHPEMVANLASAAPEIARGLTGERSHDATLTRAQNDALTDYADFDRVRASFVSHFHEQLDAPAISGLKARRVPILCWTIRDQDQADTALKIADNITFEGFAPR